MTKRHSIAEASTHLPELVREVEGGEVVELTRDGKVVAKLVAEQEQAAEKKVGWFDAWQQWRQKYADVLDDLDPDEIWGDVRDKSPGRDVEL
jgi:cellobiose PTS system EIIB component